VSWLELVTFWQHCGPGVEPPLVLVLVVLVEVDLDDVLVGLDVVVGQAVVVALLELVVPQFGFGMAETTLTRARAAMRVLENIVGFVRRKGVVDERRDLERLVWRKRGRENCCFIGRKSLCVRHLLTSDDALAMSSVQHVTHAEMNATAS
jgi:hypothetical protein